MRKLILMLAVSIGVVACGDGGSSNLVETDLLEYGIPVKVMAPDSANIKSTKLSIVTDVTIKGKPDDKYNVQIFSSGASTIDTKSIKDEQKEQIQDNPYFSQIISEDENGFVYETKLDSTTTNYGFRYVKVMGDKEIIFQNGMLGIYTLKETQRMYDSVK